MKFIEPYETLRPCRSRVIAGIVMIAVLAGLVFLLSE